MSDWYYQANFLFVQPLTENQNIQIAYYNQIQSEDGILQVIGIILLKCWNQTRSL